jgi:hypothetical protein
MKTLRQIIEEAQLYAYQNEPPLRQKPTYDDLLIEKMEELLKNEILLTTLDYKNEAHYNGWLDMRDEIVKNLIGEKNVNAN